MEKDSFWVDHWFSILSAKSNFLINNPVWSLSRIGGSCGFNFECGSGHCHVLKNDLIIIKKKSTESNEWIQKIETFAFVLKMYKVRKLWCSNLNTSTEYVLIVSLNDRILIFIILTFEFPFIQLEWCALSVLVTIAMSLTTFRKLRSKYLMGYWAVWLASNET